MTYYIKGGSRYNEANPTLWVALNLDGFNEEIYYTDPDWKQINYESIIDSDDPFWLMGSETGGAKEFELGLYGTYRIRFKTTGIEYYDGSWKNLLSEGGASNLSELDDVVISGTPADNELLSWDTTSSKWINQTPAEAGLSVDGHGHGQLHDESHSLASHSSEAHSELTDYNAETDVKHLTDAQLGDLHAIYTLEEHNNTKHNPNYHTESDGAGAVTVHSGVSDAGSGAIITVNERNALHPAIGAGDLLHNSLGGLNADNDYEHINQGQKDLLHAIYTLEAHDHDGDTLKIDGITSDGGTFTFSFSANSGMDIEGVGDTTFGFDNPGAGDINVNVNGDITLTGLVDGVDIAGRDHAATVAGDLSHNSLADIDADDIKHLTGDQLGNLHSIYTLEVHANEAHDPDFCVDDDGRLTNDRTPLEHSNTKHSPNYHTESDGAGSATVHSDLDTIGSGAIITVNERNALHPLVTAANASIVLVGQEIKLSNENGVAITQIEDDALADSSSRIPTNKAVKRYVDALSLGDTKEVSHAYVEANALTLTATLTTRDINLGSSYGVHMNGNPADDSYTGIILDINTTGCGVGQPVYIDGSNSVLPAKADAIGTMPCIGICVATNKVLTHGVFRDDSGLVLTAAKVVYVSENGNIITTTAPNGVGDIVQVVGIAINTDEIFVNPSLDWVVRK